MAIRIGINGFGRIGRVVFRGALLDKDIEVVHINDLTAPATSAHLLKYDSVHGKLAQEVSATDDSIQIGSHKVSVSACRNPEDIPWKQHNVDIVFECTGIFRSKDQVQAHLKAGAKKVLISAPAKDEDITVVYGVNDENLKNDHIVVSNGSCTTNCLAPLAKVVHENFGILSGQMTTVHAYTNDQSILDIAHKDLRRARAAAQNMIPTSTGAAKAISLVMPELKGKIQGLAVRVPTANVSLVDLTVNVEKSTTAEEVNSLLKTASESGRLQGVLGYSDQPLVSMDFNGSTHSSTIDALSTSVSNGNLLKVLSWYDNETGFSYRMLDVAKLMAKGL